MAQENLKTDNPEDRSIDIGQPADVALAGRIVGEVVRSLGFPPADIWAMDIVVRELATNLIKHAHGGLLRVRPVSRNGRIGVELEASDRGPGIRDAERAFAEKHSTAGTLGVGLAAVNRLMDKIDIDTGPGKGTRVTCRRWLRQNEAPAVPGPLAVGVATRVYPGQTINGDSFVVKRWGKSILVAVIDGLGHGQSAHYAAEKARQYVESHYDLPLDEIFRGAGRNCLATRGVVMAIARFDWAEEKMVFASIGNIETRIIGAKAPPGLLVRRGIIGLNAPRAGVTEQRWDMDGVMVMHSDGLTAHWSEGDFPGLTAQPADVAAQDLLKKLARDNDDATVIVIKRKKE